MHECHYFVCSDMQSTSLVNWQTFFCMLAIVINHCIPQLIIPSLNSKSQSHKWLSGAFLLEVQLIINQMLDSIKTNRVTCTLAQLLEFKFSCAWLWCTCNDLFYMQADLCDECTLGARLPELSTDQTDSDTSAGAEPYYCKTLSKGIVSTYM